MTLSSLCERPSLQAWCVPGCPEGLCTSAGPLVQSLNDCMAKALSALLACLVTYRLQRSGNAAEKWRSTMACHRTSSFVGPYPALIGICDGIPLHAGAAGGDSPCINLHCAGSWPASRKTAGGACERPWRWAGAARCRIQINWNGSRNRNPESVLELSEKFAFSAARFRQKIALILSHFCRA